MGFRPCVDWGEFGEGWKEGAGELDDTSTGETLGSISNGVKMRDRRGHIPGPCVDVLEDMVRHSQGGMDPRCCFFIWEEGLDHIQWCPGPGSVLRDCFWKDLGNHMG